MNVRDHRSQHETARSLPLITSTATVTGVEALDRSRNDEVEKAIAQRLAAVNETQLFRYADDGHPRIRWASLREALQRGQLPNRIAPDIRKLAERQSRPYPSLLRVRLDMSKSFEFVAGQYVAVTFRGTPRPYSVASSPSELEMELCIRRVPGGRLTSDLFDHLSVGDEVTVRGPAGEFVLNDPSPRDIAFLATGTGIAPLRSMLEFALDEGLDRYGGEYRNIWIFLGAGWADDLPYRDRFESLAARHDHVHFIPCCTREPLLSDWTGETDYVQHVLVKYLSKAVPTEDLPSALRRYREPPLPSGTAERIDPDNLEVYACGVNDMVESLVRTVKQLGVPSQHVDAEGYG